MPTPNEHPPAPGLVERLMRVYRTMSWEGCMPLLPEIIATLRQQEAEIAERGKRIKELKAELRDRESMSWEDATT